MLVVYSRFIGKLNMQRLPSSLASPEWELIDPTPDPVALFLAYNQQFFWGKLESVIVKWSPQMTS